MKKRVFTSRKSINKPNIIFLYRNFEEFLYITQQRFEILSSKNFKFGSFVFEFIKTMSILVFKKQEV